MFFDVMLFGGILLIVLVIVVSSNKIVLFKVICLFGIKVLERLSFM